jgi:hypothetical protein
MGGSLKLRSLAFLTPGNFPDDDPHAGLEATLQLFELGERLGFDGAWVRQRHLEHGISSAATFLAAATQRTASSRKEKDVAPASGICARVGRARPRPSVASSRSNPDEPAPGTAAPGTRVTAVRAGRGTPERAAA